MIEVLASVALFSVGLVGLAGLSLASLRATADGQFVSQATYIAEELADVMRANLQGYEAANFASTPATTTKICSPEAACTPAEQAQYDAGKWQWHTVSELPGGIALVCMDSTPNDGNPEAAACDGAGLNTLKIFWQDARNDEALTEGETFHRYVLAVIP